MIIVYDVNTNEISGIAYARLPLSREDIDTMNVANLPENLAIYRVYDYEKQKEIAKAHETGGSITFIKDEAGTIIDVQGIAKDIPPSEPPLTNDERDMIIADQAMQIAALQQQVNDNSMILADLLMGR